MLIYYNNVSQISILSSLQSMKADVNAKLS